VFGSRGQRAWLLKRSEKDLQSLHEYGLRAFDNTWMVFLFSNLAIRSFVIIYIL